MSKRKWIPFNELKKAKGDKLEKMLYKDCIHFLDCMEDCKELILHKRAKLNYYNILTDDDMQEIFDTISGRYRNFMED